MKIYENILKKPWGKIGAFAVLCLSLSSCLKDNKDTAAPPTALLATVVAIPDVQPLDFYLNGDRVSQTPLSFGSIVPYVNAFAGQRTANFDGAGTSTTFSTGTISLTAQNAYSLFLVNTSASPQQLLLADTLTKPISGDANIRFVNAGPDAPAVDLAIQGGAVLVANKAFKGYSSFAPVAGGEYTLEVRKAGTSTVLATLPNAVLTAGYVYTIWLGGLVNPTTSSDMLGINIVSNAFY